MRLRTVCQPSNAPAHGLSVQKCACVRSVSATMLLLRSVIVAMRLSTLVCQYSNFCPLKECLLYPTLRTRLISSLVISSFAQERNHMYEIVVYRVCRKFMKNH